MYWNTYTDHRGEVDYAIRAVANRLRLNSSDAQDFAQDARCFLADHGQPILQRFRGEGSLKAYLFKVFWRFGLAWVTRSNHTRPRRVADDKDADRPLPYFPQEPIFHAAIVSLANWLRTLPPEDQFLITGRFVERKPVRDLATSMGTTQSAAFKRLYRLLSQGRRAVEASGVGSTDLPELLQHLQECEDELFSS